MAWSLSLYPQLLGNWRRRSVVGFSLDLALLNPAGFLCLLAYYGSFTFSPSVRAAYRRAAPPRPFQTLPCKHAACPALELPTSCLLPAGLPLHVWQPFCVCGVLVRARSLCYHKLQ